MNETTELIMRQLNQKKTHAITHEVGGGDEIDVLKLKNVGNLLIQSDLVINVKKFGAKGDGVTDDTENTQSAIDTAGLSGGTVFFPKGTYLIKDVLNVNQTIGISMDAGAVIISGKSGTSLTVGVFNITASDVVLRDVKINVSSKDMRGIYATGANNLVLDNVEVINSGMSGVWIEYSSKVSVRNLNFENCMNGAYGDNRAGSLRFNHCTDVSVDTVFIKNTQGKGLSFEDCIGFEVSKVVVDTTLYQSAGLYFNNSSKGNISLCHVYNADQNAIKYSRGSSYVNVSNSTFSTRAQLTGEEAGGYVCIFQGATYCSLSKSVLLSSSSINGLRIQDHPDPEGSDTHHIKVEGNTIDVRGVTQGTGVPLCIHVKKDPATTYLVNNIDIRNNDLVGGLQGIRAETIPYLTIEGNKFDGHSSTVIQVLPASVVKGLKICRNFFKDALATAISITSTEDFDVNENEIKASASIAASISGITAGASCKNGNINNNRIYGFTGNLINCSNTTVDTMNIIGNIGVGGTGAVRGVDFRGNNARITNNQFSAVTLKIYVDPACTGVHQAGNTPSKKGTSTTSGNGSLTSVAIAHGLGVTPTDYDVVLASVDAGTAGKKYVTADATNVTVFFNIAPISGTNNLKLLWRAEV